MSSNEEQHKKKSRRNLYIVIYILAGTVSFIIMVAGLFVILNSVTTIVLNRLNFSFDITIPMTVTTETGEEVTQNIPGTSGVVIAMYGSLIMVSFALSLWFYSILTRTVGRKFKLYRFLPEIFPNKK